MEDFTAFEEAFENINIKPGLRPTAINPAVLLSNVHQVESSIPPDTVIPSRSGYVFDSLMENHRPFTEIDKDHPEQPERIRRIYEALRTNALLARMKRLLPRPVTREEACLVHSYAHWDSVQAIRGEPLWCLGRISSRNGSLTLRAKATLQRISGYLMIDIVRSLFMCAQAPPRLRNLAVAVVLKQPSLLQEARLGQPLRSSALLVTTPNPRGRWGFVFSAILLWQHVLCNKRHQSSEY